MLISHTNIHCKVMPVGHPGQGNVLKKRPEMFIFIFCTVYCNGYVTLFLELF